ncbi:MAG: hypothetical protein RI962_472 [Pseudomonadota bacterium]|jgi:hypothetical protein
MNEQFPLDRAEFSVSKAETADHVWLAPAGFVTVRLASMLTGLSQPAIRGKIREGKWVQGREFVRAPDGGIFISLRGFERWVCAGSK